MINYISESMIGEGVLKKWDCFNDLLNFFSYENINYRKCVIPNESRLAHLEITTFVFQFVLGIVALCYIGLVFSLVLYMLTISNLWFIGKFCEKYK